MRVLAPLAAQAFVTAAAVDAAAQELGLRRAQCYRLLRRLRADPTVTALLPRQSGRVTNTRFLAGNVEAVIGAAIEEFYLCRSRPSVADLVREIGRRCLGAQLRPPSYKAVAARVRLHDQREVLRRRYGAAHARNSLGRVVGRLAADEPLSLVQIDHTLADVIVVASTDRRPLGRPWLTLAIDVATRMVTGFHLSLEPPSALSVALALSHAVLPKEEYLQGRGVDLPWPVCGLPQCLHLDNAKEFRSDALTRGAAQYSIELRYRPPATPHWGGHIERLIGTVMGSLRLLPGATGRSVADRGPDPEATAAMTLDELENWLVHQIVGVYHQTQHRGLGTAPLTAWVETVARSSMSPRLPQDLDRFYLDFLPFRRRIIRREGLALFNLCYSDGVLATFLRKPRQLVIVRYDPRDMSQVYLRDEEGSYWPIPLSDRRLPAVTLAEIRAASRRLNEAGERSLSQRRIFEAIEDQRAIVTQAHRHTRLARREQERRTRALRSEPHHRAAGGSRAAEPADDPDVGPILPFPVEEWS